MLWGYREALRGQVRRAAFFPASDCMHSPRKGARGVFLSLFQARIIIYKCQGGKKRISAGFQPAAAQAPAAADNGPIAALAEAGAGWGSPLLFPFPVPHVCSWLPATVSAGSECS